MSNPIEASESENVVDFAALAVPQLSKLIGVPKATIERHIADGAPTVTRRKGEDPTMHLLQYAAWLTLRYEAHTSR